MSFQRCAAALLAAAVIGIPASAAIKAMDLAELMGITTDAIHGRIVAKSTFQMDRPQAGAVYTKLTIEGRSLRTGEPMTKDVIFHGSHDPADWYTISEMPTLQDTRVGGEVIAFYFTSEWRGGHHYLFDLSGLYRVEQGFGEPAVIGKGEGMAFPENTKLSVAEQRIRATHLALAAAKAEQK